MKTIFSSHLIKSSIVYTFLMASICFCESAIAQSCDEVVKLETSNIRYLGDCNGLYFKSPALAPGCDCWVREDGGYTINNPGGQWIIYAGKECLSLNQIPNVTYVNLRHNNSCDPTTIPGVTQFSKKNAAPKKMAIYYGWPSAVSAVSNGNAPSSAAYWKQYDLVVFGEGLESSNHGDHNNTMQIITAINEDTNAETKVYGYIPLGNRANDDRHTMSVIEGKIDSWKDMGIHGIFLDEAGEDYAVNRQRQNQAIDLVHDADLKVMINAWEIDDVFSTTEGRAATRLNADDYYLMEGFGIIYGSHFGEQYTDDNGDTHTNSLSTFQTKAQKAFDYSNQYGTKIATVSTTNSATFEQNIMNEAWWLTVLYGFDAMAYGELDYSAGASPIHEMRQTSISASHDPQELLGCDLNRLPTFQSSTNEYGGETSRITYNFDLNTHRVKSPRPRHVRE